MFLRIEHIEGIQKDLAILLLKAPFVWGEEVEKGRLQLEAGEGRGGEGGGRRSANLDPVVGIELSLSTDFQHLRPHCFLWYLQNAAPEL